MRNAEALTPADVAHAAKILSALDSELRLRIVLLLADGEHVVHQLVDALGKSQPLISQHLRVLKSAGLVASRREGREVVYTLIQPAVVDVIEQIAGLAADELSVRRQAKVPPVRTGSGAAIISPTTAIRPDEDQGLAPQTPRPRHD
ncbi:helix-turn-helix transcriptional regulator [Corynebacterium sp. CNCTC7651]|uniref:ArsR/SmtB family transcription factor n=1 Tax=Corynebacterium sp. CNCTC7651 TaxID=2815361 RepID=UPI001F15FAC4|nr:metalloregulator ArsR/SmtB family transcription factor [Corynebacterium sp. CNCTC7651]UIZ91691.1 helix-turn-helix transcriptional regulator [Corynebacterium sp. CNCTC7651]